MHGSGAVFCSCSLLIRGPILPAVRQKLHLSPCADSRSRLSIEANTCLAKCAAERFRTQISSGQLRILNIGIAAEEGELPFWICETYSEWSSFDQKIASRDGCPHHEVMVPCRRFASVLEEFGVPYYLKVDIEGNDILCLQDLNPRRLPKFVSMESASSDVITLMAERGFKRFKAISQYNFLPIELPPSPEQRRYERVQWMLQTRNPLIRAFRLFGGRGWLNRQLIPNPIDQNPWAHWRSPMDMMRQG